MGLYERISIVFESDLQASNLLVYDFNIPSNTPSHAFYSATEASEAVSGAVEPVCGFKTVQVIRSDGRASFDFQQESSSQRHRRNSYFQRTHVCRKQVLQRLESALLEPPSESFPSRVRFDEWLEEDLYLVEYDIPRAWRCWDQGRRIAPTFGNFAPVNQFEQSLLSQHPEYFE